MQSSAMCNFSNLSHISFTVRYMAHRLSFVAGAMCVVVPFLAPPRFSDLMCLEAKIFTELRETRIQTNLSGDGRVHPQPRSGRMPIKFRHETFSAGTGPTSFSPIKESNSIP